MEKKIWSRPLTKVQGFEANEYVAACGVNEKGEYLFKCDFPQGKVYVKSGDSYKPVRSGNISYHPCGKTHTTTDMGDFVDGYVDQPNRYGSYNGKKDSGEEAIIWVEYNSKGSVVDFHATKNVDWKTWTEPAVRS